MVRTRTTVKPGLLLQPAVVFQLVGQLVEEVLEGSEVVGVEYQGASWLNVVGRATPSELAVDLGLRPTTLSSVIERLVRKGQVRRVANPEDGRSYLVELTRSGKATNARNSARFAKVIARVRANLELEEEELLAQLQVFEAALRASLRP